MMTRNQKIALGCGGAGCLGLILLIVIGIVLGAAGYIAFPGSSTNRNYNYNSNSNFNYNSNSNSNSSYNRNSNTSSTTSTTMSNDDKHKLFQAASSTQDQALMRRVLEKLGLLKANGSPTDDYAPFVRDHIGWVFRNTDFLQSVNTPEKARAYVDEHIDD